MDHFLCGIDFSFYGTQHICRWFNPLSQNGKVKEKMLRILDADFWGTVYEARKSLISAASQFFNRIIFAHHSIGQIWSSLNGPTYLAIGVERLYIKSDSRHVLGDNSMVITRVRLATTI